MNDLMVVEKLANWEKLKTMVLDSVSSPITKRVYNMALNEFMVWFQQAPRAGFRRPPLAPGVCRWRPAVSVLPQSSFACLRFVSWRRRPPIMAC